MPRARGQMSLELSGLMPWQGSAEFSDHALGRLRLRLDRWWGEGPRALICGCNPSNADGECNDPTVWRCIELCRGRWSGFTMVNWEPYISSSPIDLHAWRNKFGGHEAYLQICIRNLDLLRALSADAAIRFVAWGNLVPFTPHTQKVIKALSLDGQRDLYAFGLTKDRAPKHPMARGAHRILTGAEPVLWQPRLA